MRCKMSLKQFQEKKSLNGVYADGSCLSTLPYFFFLSRTLIQWLELQQPSCGHQVTLKIEAMT